MRKIGLYIVTLVLALSPLACNSAKPKAKGGGPRPAATPLPTANPGTDSDPEPKDRSNSECEDGGLQLKLIATVDYKSTLKAILDRSCTASCHPGGGTTKDLTTYSGAKSFAAAMVTSVDNGTMPPGGGMSDADKQAFRDWVDSGTPEILQDDAGSTGAGTGGGSGSGNPGDDFFGDCNDSVEDDEIFDNVKECKDKGKIYDYKRDSCTTDVGDYDCDKDGIIKAFKDKRVLVEDKIEEYEDDGYEIDQCGESSEGPIVIFVKKYESTDVTVEAKNLCMPGSQFCR